MNCLNCKKQIVNATNERKFCSRSCAATFNNQRYPKRRKRPATNECLQCGRLTHNVKYCNQACATTHKINQPIKNWLAGDYDLAQRKTGILKSNFRRYLLEQADYTCQSCGWNEINPVLGYSPVEIDHIDGNWKNTHPDNLRVICPNCHSLEPTYKALNRGNNQLVGDNYFYKRKYDLLVQVEGFEPPVSLTDLD